MLPLPASISVRTKCLGISRLGRIYGWLHQSVAFMFTVGITSRNSSIDYYQTTVAERCMRQPEG